MKKPGTMACRASMLIESRTYSTNSNARLSLRELEPAAGAALAVLLTLLHAAVAGHEPGAAERGFEGLVVLHQGPAESHDDRAGLAARAAAGRVDEDVHL